MILLLQFLSRIRHHNRQNHACDEHAEWLGIGGGIHLHAQGKY